MEVRPIDGNELKNRIRHMPRTVHPDLLQYSLVQAIIVNMPTLIPPNEPLALEELRQMNGQPVWGKSLINNKPGEWFILRIAEMSKTWFVACAGSTQVFGDKDTYGKTWLAYRRPQE